MRRAGLIGLALVAILALLVVVLAHSPMVLDWAVARSSATVRTRGLMIHWGGRLSADAVELRDRSGVYARVQTVSVVWSPLRLLRNDVDVARLRAGRAELLRLPEASSSGRSTGSTTGSTKIEVHALQVDRLQLPAALAGTAAPLRVDGSGTWISADDAAIALTAERIGGGGTYDLSASIAPSAIHAQLAVREQGGGLVAHAAGLPDIGPIDLTASVSGPRSDLATQLALAAGKLRADGHGHVDLDHRTLTANIDATAPAMTPRPGLSFQSVKLTATASGGFTDPNLTGSFEVRGLAAFGAGVQRIALDATGNKGQVRVRAQLDGITVPGRQPDLFAAAPVLLTADANLAAADRPVVFTLRHPLFDASGTLHPAGAQPSELRLTIPRIGPLAAAAGLDLEGSTSLHLSGARQSGATRLGLDGTLSLTHGIAPGPALIGESARLGLEARVSGDSLDVTRLQIDGQDVSITVRGQVAPDTVAVRWSATLPRLTAVDPHLVGSLRAEGHISGSERDLALAADIAGSVGVPGQPSGPFTAHVEATGLPHDARASFTAQGALLGAPMRLAAQGTRLADGAIRLTVQQADWNSASLKGALVLPAGATVPDGDIELVAPRLADFTPLVGRQLTGSAHLSLHATPAALELTAGLHDAGVSGAGSVADATATATIADPASHPMVHGRIMVTGASVGAMAGSISLDASGPADRLALGLSASLPRLDGAAARLASTATVDVAAKTVTLATLSADWRGRTLRLLAPARIAFSDGVSIDGLRLGLGDAVLQVNGRASPTLDLTASAQGVPASLAALVRPGLTASGTLSAQVRLTGTPVAPNGTVQVTGTGLRLGIGTHLPPVALAATAVLQGKDAQIDARFAAGSSHVSIAGRAPFSSTAPLQLKAQGTIDLALADKLLAARAGGLAGAVVLSAAISGTPARPQGTIRAQASGVRWLSETGRGLPPASIAASATLDGASARLDARLGAGTSHLALSGSVPLRLAGPLALRATGTIDLAVADPLLAANGQRVAGTVTTALGIGGSVTAPRIVGAAELRDGDVQDYVRGVHLSAIAAHLAAAGDVLRLDSLTARAGQGTIGGSGTIGVLQPGIPVDLKLTAHDASPLSGGFVTGTLDAALGIRGDASTGIALSGSLNVRQALIRVPSKLPASVATIPVRIVGAPPAPPRAPPGMAPAIALDLTIRAPEQVYVRGRGLNAELGGTISLRGTTERMQSSGRFTLRRGTLSLVGTTLTFTAGDIDFNSGSLTDPAIHLVAMSASGTSSSTLTVSGTAQDPKITLSSVPVLPQDQILAQLLFPSSNGRLSPFQLASIAAALAELSGSTSNFPNPLQGVQNALGLDALGIGSGPNGAASLQAGRYIGRRLYVGAQQSTGGTGAQGTIQYDITKGLKLNATVGTGETTSAIGASGQSSGASVGVTYQFEY